MPAQCSRPSPLPPAWPSHAVEMASDFFCESLRDNLGLELLVEVHLLEAPVLVLKLLHPRHHRHVHAAELGAPLVERCRADSKLPTQFGHRFAGFRALERRHDLAVRKSRLLHAELPPLE